MLISLYFAGVPCATGDWHTGSPPYPGQHQSRGELPDPRGGRLNQHGKKKSTALHVIVCWLWLLRCTLDLLRTHAVTRTRWCPGETTRCTRGLDTPSPSPAPSQGEQIVCNADCMQTVLSQGWQILSCFFCKSVTRANLWAVTLLSNASVFLCPQILEWFLVSFLARHSLCD